jgi:hypothetical protein
MTTTPIIPARPVAPTAPSEYVRLVERHNDAVRAGNRGRASFLDAFETLAALNRWLKQTDAGRAFAAQVDAYNAQVGAYNTALTAERQARINRREVNRVRAAACPRCCATHPGEC